ncbi:GAF domain-containing DNA-binding protein [Hymenobacter sp. BT186]|uniref:GAF domain-containing DNA-binding protein n=1 Tax=Hymenobacter telluris TaxID=2816474 RepID=A0A939ETH7_9BACT|nr:GAF domain-containing DNA-binding protein [Hymenobacter telluris]MBO0357001.1 GAF domain-containing DNA-binding protein [Hymenobacter telluris]MBW3373028.1 GAF domain-containing DNA-binding protein [Hymenobacter norwichensis]
MSPAAKITRPPVSALQQPNEAERLEVLRNYQILDTPPEKAFDDLVRLAAYICGTSVSLVSLIDAERQWFKANVGLTQYQETHRDAAFCQYAMLSNDVFEVADATQDPLFRQNPMVIADPNIRFYAGAALISPEGMPLGTICALDTEPRTLTEQQRDALRILAREVVAHLELRRARLQLEMEQQKLEGLLRMANNAAESMFVGSRNEIFVKQDHKLVRVHTEDIRYVEALGDYVNIYTSRERYTVYSTMKELEAKLPAREFARIHRKYIVCLDRITAIEGDTIAVDTGRGTDRQANPTTVPIGNSYKAALLNRLNLI